MRKRNVRRQANRKLPEIYNKHMGLCHYCGSKTVMVRSVLSILVKLRAFTVSYIRNGTHITSNIATIDHVKDLSLGGTNDNNNLVLACALCNNTKNDIKQGAKNSRKSLTAVLGVV